LERNKEQVFWEVFFCKYKVSTRPRTVVQFGFVGGTKMWRQTFLLGLALLAIVAGNPASARNLSDGGLLALDNFEGAKDVLIP
jgi:hypothetical protein